MSRLASNAFLLLILVSAWCDASHLVRHRHGHYHFRRQDASTSQQSTDARDLKQLESELTSIGATLGALLDRAKLWLTQAHHELAASTTDAQGLASSNTAEDNTSFSASTVAVSASSSGASRTTPPQTTTITTYADVTSTTTVTLQTSSSSVLAHASHLLAGQGGALAHTGRFDAIASTNIAVYYGQDPETTTDGLARLCKHPRISIINMAFVSTFFSSGGYPETALGPACDLPSNQAVSTRASGLQNCTTLGKQINTCQKKYGKKILVSLGGYYAASSFSSTRQAQQFATTVWNLFGGGTETPNLRPFGPGVVVDGFDIDNEDHNTSYWFAFATALKAHYARDPKRKYYLSAAPQCPRPDASIPKDVLRICDFVFTQFYNNPSCNVDSTGFFDSLKAWSTDLMEKGKASPRLFIGMPAFPGAGSGYVEGPQLAKKLPTLGTLRKQIPNFGGVSMWAGAEAVSNVDASGKTFLQHVAAILQTH